MFDAAKVTQAYVGLDRACRCGCKGVYHEPNSVGLARAVARVKHQFSMFPGDVGEKFLGEVNYNVSLPNNRAVTVYVKVD